MPFCGNCGTKVEAGEKFCGNCGANIEEQLSAPAVYQAQAPVQNPVENMGSQPGQLEQGSKKGLVIAICAAVLVVVAAVLIFLGISTASPASRMQRRSQEFFDQIVEMDLRGMLACVDPTETQQVLDSLDALSQYAGGEDAVMQLLSRSFLQMAVGEAFDPTTVEAITIEDFDVDY